MRRSAVTLLFLLVVQQWVYGQKPAHIKVKKASLPFLFFNKNTTRDTIYPGKSDCFYLWVPDSLKPVLDIETLNAQLMAQKNDSTVLLRYVPGINYLQKYSPVMNESEKPEVNKPWLLLTLIDGANQTDRKKIQVIFRNKLTAAVFATFVYMVP
jgi:hypothetical protein